MSNLASSNSEYICFDEKDTMVLNAVDTHFLEVAKSLGAVEYHIPALIEHSILDKCGYFSKFPQHLTVAAHANPLMYENIITEHQINNTNSIVEQKYFTPAACLHIYPMLKNNKVNNGVITTKARVYRYEDGRFNGSTRIWDFTVREIVFVGKEEFVCNSIEQMKKATIEYAKKWMLPISISAAYDNFYPTKRNVVTQKIQKTNLLKYESIVNISGNNVAIGSFNYHDTHFSKSFDFDENGEIVTGCVGYGLERWVAAINYYNPKE